MNIAIKSEVDSRVFVYPLLKCLYDYGTICLYTSNMNCSRLIEGEWQGGFKDIRVIVVNDGDLHSAMVDDQHFEGKYDFTIFDNVGAVDYDLIIALVTNHISESYVQDLSYIIDDNKCFILKFGKPAPPLPKEKGSKTKPVKKLKTKNEENAIEEPLVGQITKDVDTQEDFSYNKWDVQKTDEDILQEKLSSKESKWCPYPSFEDLEIMESRHYMMVPNDTVMHEVYRLIVSQLSIEERMFKKGVRVKDESSSNISGTDVR